MHSVFSVTRLYSMLKKTIFENSRPGLLSNYKSRLLLLYLSGSYILLHVHSNYRKYNLPLALLEEKMMWRRHSSFHHLNEGLLLAKTIYERNCTDFYISSILIKLFLQILFVFVCLCVQFPLVDTRGVRSPQVDART